MGIDPKVYNNFPPKWGRKGIKGFRGREENQRRVKRKGREGERKGKERKRKDKRKGRSKRKNEREGKEENGQGGNAKEPRNFGISLVIHDRGLSGVYILL